MVAHDVTLLLTSILTDYHATNLLELAKGVVAHDVTHAGRQVAAQLDVTELVVVPLHLVSTVRSSRQ